MARKTIEIRRDLAGPYWSAIYDRALVLDVQDKVTGTRAGLTALKGMAKTIIEDAIKAEDAATVELGFEDDDSHRLARRYLLGLVGFRENLPRRDRRPDVERYTSLLPPGFEGFDGPVDYPARDLGPFVPTAFTHFDLKYGDVITFGGVQPWRVISSHGDYSMGIERLTDTARTRLRFEAHVVDTSTGEFEIWSVGYLPNHSWGRLNDKVYDQGRIRDIRVVG